MNWWLLGGGLGIVAVVAIAVWALGAGAVFKLAVDLFKLVVEGARDAVNWLRKPGSKLKAVCGLLAFVSLTFGVQSFRRGEVIIQQRTSYAQLERDSKAKAESLEAELSLRDQRINEFRELARQQIALLDAQKLENEAAVAAAFKAGQEAAKSAAKYQNEFEKKPPECTAALEVMQQACPTLSDY